MLKLVSPRNTSAQCSIPTWENERHKLPTLGSSPSSSSCSDDPSWEKLSGMWTHGTTAEHRTTASVLLHYVSLLGVKHSWNHHFKPQIPSVTNTWGIHSSDLLRPFSRIHHHSLPKAVIHIRRHCFGRRRLEALWSSYPNRRCVLISSVVDIKKKKSPPAVFAGFLSLCSDASRISWECPEPGHDRSQTAEQAPRGCPSLCCPGRNRLP